MKTYFIILSIFLFCVIHSVSAQDPAIKHYTVKDGLPSSTIYGSLKDKDGFLWFGTDAGVARFNGKEFTNFTITDGLSDNEVLFILQDSKERIWFLGFNGTVSYFLLGKFYNPGNDSLAKKIRSATSLMYAFEDKSKNLYFCSSKDYVVVRDSSVNYLELGIGMEGFFVNSDKPNEVFLITPYHTFSGGIYQLKGKETYIKHDAKYYRKHNNGYGYTSEGELLFRSAEGIVKQRDTVQQLILPLKGRFNNTSQYGILLTTEKKLWITTTGDGIFCYNYTDLKKPPLHFLKGIVTAAIIQDHENNLWVGTIGDGIYMLPVWHQKVKNYSASNGLEMDQVNTIIKNKNNELILGLSEGKINKIVNNKVYKSDLSRDLTKYNRITKLLQDNESLWITTDRGLILRTASDYKPIVNNYGKYDMPVKDIVKLNNDLFVVSSYEIFKLLKPHNRSLQPLLQVINVKPKRIYCIASDKKGNLWYGTAEGLFSYISNIETNHAGEHELLQKRINDILEINDSVLVLATYGYGVLLYKNGKVLQHITSANGLSSDICRKLFIFRNTIFAATPSGLSKLTYNNGYISDVTTLTTSQGLASNDVNDVYADKDDLCIATSGGVTILKTNEEDNHNLPSPPLYITSVKEGTRLLSPDSTYKLSHTNNSITLNFIALTYQQPENVIYQYQLLPQTTWIETKNTSVDFAALSPGEYTFNLRAKILNGAWSKTKTFHFEIKSPVWKRTWFILLSFLIMATLIFVLILSRLNTLKKRRLKTVQLQHQISHLEQQALQAMMNPHFIFNVMNSIQHYINKNDKHAANIYLAEFARLIRMNLEISSKSFISLEEEINYLELYLYLEKFRFDENLSYDIHVDAAIDTYDTTIPVMILQPFIENAIWHGILPKKTQGHIQVNFIRHSDELIKVEIIDDGVGMPETVIQKTSHKSLGLKIIQDRLDLISKIHGHSLYIKKQQVYPNAEFKGTKIEMIIPGNL